MKAIHKKDNAVSEDDELDQAKSLEQEGNLEDAAKLYEKITSRNPVSEFAYNRLMIIYRKLKDHRKELATVKKAIASFEKMFESVSRVKVTGRIASLSKSLLKSLGLTDRKGKAVYEREPLGRWRKRKLVVERLLKKKSK